MPRSAPTNSRSAFLITAGSALWVFFSASRGVWVDEEPVWVDLSLYVGLLVSTVGALMALVGVRRLLRQVEPRLSAPGARATSLAEGDPTETAAARRRSRLTPSALITIGVLLYLAADNAYWLLPTTGGGVLTVLYGAVFVAGYVGPVIALIGLYRLLGRIDDHVGAS